MWIQLQEKIEKNPRHQQYQEKHHLMVIVMKKLSVWIKPVSIMENILDILTYIQILLAIEERATENIGERLHY